MDAYRSARTYREEKKKEEIRRNTIFNLKKIQRAAEALQNVPNVKQGGKSRESWPWLNPHFLPPGVHKFRLLPPHTEKNPNGIHNYVKHTIAQDQAQKQKMTILCPSSYDEECPICEFVGMVASDEKFLHNLPEDAYKIILSWAPKINRLVPCVWKLTKELKPGSDWPDYYYDENAEMPVLLNLVQNKKSLDGVYDDILGLVQLDNELPDLEDGKWIKFTKRGDRNASYKLFPTDELAVLQTEEEIMEQYPPIASYGKNYKKDKASIIGAIESSWAYDQFTKVFGPVEW